MKIQSLFNKYGEISEIRELMKIVTKRKIDDLDIIKDPNYEYLSRLWSGYSVTARNTLIPYLRNNIANPDDDLEVDNYTIEIDDITKFKELNGLIIAAMTSGNPQLVGDTQYDLVGLFNTDDRPLIMSTGLPSIFKHCDKIGPFILNNFDTSGDIDDGSRMDHDNQGKFISIQMSLGMCEGTNSGKSLLLGVSELLSYGDNIHSKSLRLTNINKRSLKNIVIHTNTHSPIYLVDSLMYNLLETQYSSDESNNLPEHIVNLNASCVSIDVEQLVLREELNFIEDTTEYRHPYKYYLLQKLKDHIDIGDNINIFELLVVMLHIINTDYYLISLFSEHDLNFCYSELEKLKNDDNISVSPILIISQNLRSEIFPETKNAS